MIGIPRCSDSSIEEMEAAFAKAKALRSSIVGLQWHLKMQVDIIADNIVAYGFPFGENPKVVAGEDNIVLRYRGVTMDADAIMAAMKNRGLITPYDFIQHGDKGA